MTDVSQEKKAVNPTPPTTKSRDPLILPDTIKQEEKIKINEEELKEGLNTEKIGSFKEDILVGDQVNVNMKKRKEYSKYDFIKVRVTLGEHFYVLSRFLVSRMLTLCKIPHLDAVKIAKDLKKHLIEANKLDIPQEEVNETLFDFMNAYNYGEQYINRYKMISKFYQKRTPMIIMISGTVGIAKSIIATHLAERMNISNVLQTDIVESVMTKMYPEQFKDNLKIKNFNTKEELLEEYKKRCKAVRRGGNTDMHKCLVEGKPLIMEGFTLDPRLYVKLANDEEVEKEVPDELVKQKLEELEELTEGNDSSEIRKEKLKKFNMNKHSNDKLKIIAYQDSNAQITEREKVLKKEIEKIDQKSAVIVPILLVLNKRDHFYCVENKIDSLKAFDGLPYQEKKKKVNSCLENYYVIQEHLLKNSSLCTVVPISINNLEETLELLQDIIIEKIEADYKNWGS